MDEFIDLEVCLDLSQYVITTEWMVMMYYCRGGHIVRLTQIPSVRHRSCHYFRPTLVCVTVISASQTGVAQAGILNADDSDGLHRPEILMATHWHYFQICSQAESSLKLRLSNFWSCCYAMHSFVAILSFSESSSSWPWHWLSRWFFFKMWLTWWLPEILY